MPRKSWNRSWGYTFMSGNNRRVTVFHGGANGSLSKCSVSPEGGHYRGTQRIQPTPLECRAGNIVHGKCGTYLIIYPDPRWGG